MKGVLEAPGLLEKRGKIKIYNLEKSSPDQTNVFIDLNI